MVIGRDTESNGAGLPGTPPDTLADLPGYLLALAPEQAGGVFVEAFAHVTEAEGGRLDWRGVAITLRAVRAPGRRGAGDEGEHAAMVVELAERAAPRPARRGPAPTSSAARRQRLGVTQRLVLERAYRLLPKVGDEVRVLPHFPDADERKALSRATNWAPGLEWIDDARRDGVRIRRTALAHDEIEYLLGRTENPSRQAGQGCEGGPAPRHGCNDPSRNPHPHRDADAPPSRLRAAILTSH